MRLLSALKHSADAPTVTGKPVSASGSARFLATLALIVRLLAILACCLSTPSVYAEQLHIAVATNFLPTLERLEPHFEAASGHTLLVSSGSTGSLYAQITNGAPYDIFLSADEERPTLLAEQRPGSRIQPYATGRLALWWPGMKHPVQDWKTLLKQGEFRHLAMANPRLAPYGVAASEILDALGATAATNSRRVLGENIGQTYSLVASGNAELGFVAWPQLAGGGKNLPKNSYALIPEELHSPVLQAGIVLKASPQAEQFMAFLHSETARKLIIEDGYGVPVRSGHD